MKVIEFINEVKALSLGVEDVILPHFDKIMQYKNADVVAKFQENFNVTSDEAQEVFDETLKFLYLAHVCHSKGEDLIITYSTQIIDEMWHTFVLFTREYSNFCEKYFGRFLHHQPFAKSHVDMRKKEYERNPGQYEVDVENKLTLQLNNVVQYLGEETLNKWYVFYETKYSKEALELLKKSGPQLARDSAGIKIIEGESLIASIVKKNALRILIVNGCGCSGKGCGAGCACNSGGGNTFG